MIFIIYKFENKIASCDRNGRLNLLVTQMSKQRIRIGGCIRSSEIDCISPLLGSQVIGGSSASLSGSARDDFRYLSHILERFG